MGSLSSQLGLKNDEGNMPPVGKTSTLHFLACFAGKQEVMWAMSMVPWLPGQT